MLSLRAAEMEALLALVHYPSFEVRGAASDDPANAMPRRVCEPDKAPTGRTCKTTRCSRISCTRDLQQAGKKRL